MKKILLLIFIGFWINAFSQSLILNEVSNGPSGSKEYMEFVVVDNSVSFDCMSLSPPCIDIRGWIFDDNSGYHGGGGVAPGALRFSFDPIWQCIPLGTIILVYNDADINADVPPSDLTMGDGNCKIVAPISNVSLFESNSTTPGAVACSYPSTGWTPGGSWTNVSLANTGDCARLVDLSGCEVFSLCYASQNLNTLIYFNSGGSGTNNVWYFNDTDPFIQANWSEGTCTAPNNQTPGLPNNAANAAYISQFNNGCNPITPTVANAVIVNHEICSCDGQASASGSGSIAGYTFVWMDDSFIPIGQTTSTATGLCDGTYYVEVTSSIGCSDTAMVTVNQGTPLSFSTSSSNPSICGGSDGSITLSGLSASASYSLSYSDDGIPVGPIAITTTAGGTFIITGLNAGGYSNIIISDGSCNSLPASVSLSDPSSPVFSISLLSNPSTCLGTDGSIHIEGTGTLLASTIYSLSYVDDGTSVGPVSITTDANADYNITGLNAGTYTSVLLNLSGCSGSQPGPITLIDPTPPVLSITNPAAVCSPSTVDITAAAVTAGSTNVGTLSYWNDAGATSALASPSAVTTSGTFYIQATNAGCTDINPVVVTVNATPNLVITNPTAVCSPSTVDITAAAVTAGSTNVGTLSYWNDAGATSALASPAAVTTSGTYYIQATNAGCTDINPVVVTVNATPNLVITNPAAVCSPSTVNITAAAVTAGSTNVGTLSYWNDAGATSALGTPAAVGTSGTYYIQATNAGCTDIEAVVVTINPTPNLIITNPAAVCSPSTVNITAAAVTAGSTNVGTLSYWNDAGATSTLATPAAVAASGTYYIQATSTGCTDIEAVVVTINPLPTFSLAGVDPTICNASDGSITISGLSNSTAYSVSYDDDGAGVGPLALNSDASGNILISGLNAGTYDNFSVTLVSTGCVGTSGTVITLINPGAPVITDLANQTVCDTYTLPAITGTGLSGNEGYWTATGGTGTQLAVGSAVTTTQTIYIYDINGSCFDEENFVVTVNNTPSITNPGAQTACASYTLPAITGTNLSGNEEYYNNSQALGGIVISGAVTSSQTVWIYDTEGACSDETSFTVTIDPLPTVSSVTGGGTYCLGDTPNDIMVAVTGSANWTVDYTLNGVGQTATGSASPINLGNAAGVYVVTNITDANCTNTASGTQTITINPIPNAPTAGTDSTYCSSWTVEPMTVSGTGGIYTWYGDVSLSNPLGTGSTFLIPADAEGIMTYYVTETILGCEGPASTVTITINDCEIVVPTAFTPNGDNVNDVWEIVDLDAVYPDNVVTVYNRWGNLLYVSEKGAYASDPWDGTYKGKTLPVASYYFIIDFNNEEVEPQKGIVSIILE